MGINFYVNILHFSMKDDDHHSIQSKFLFEYYFLGKYINEVKND